ncbi:M20 metallopeptidase family protein [Ectobacillus polymachus]|uniref:M20 metallopeptidase family protein n=1 Tax=Ectobacillus polymachus TaxID=1508806 RepID=UPI003A8C5AEE
MDRKNLDLSVQLRHELHAHPELSYQEDWTKQHLMEFLKKHTTNLEITDKGKYFYVKYMTGNNKPTIAFRADFDALPIPETIDLPWKSQYEGVAHKCGHDGHASTLAGFALEVDQKGADKNIIFLFQHAEETGQGALDAREVIKEENIEEIFAYHNMSGIPYNTVSVIDGTAWCASKGMSIEMVGSPAHASEPEKGVNPSYAIAEIVAAIPKFIAPDHYEGLVLCTIIQIDVGSENYGISAHEGALRLTIRAEKETELDKLQKKLEDFALKLGKEQGIKVSFKYSDVFPETVNTKESADKVRKVCEEKGIPLRELQKPLRSSEDFGYYQKLIKGAYFLLGNGEDHAPIHTYEYDFVDELIETGVEVFKGLAGTK